MRGRYLIKLVRDRVKDLREPPESFGFHSLGLTEHLKHLRAKLIEEATEYLLDPSRSELVDVYEAVRCLAVADLQLHDDPDIAMEILQEQADQKRLERGSFERGTGMYAEFEMLDD